ncbi:signal peptidase I [Glutamicibacter ardleyensis]|uniref:signal peptidase I n=1 Tax=Glutamicibacter ardleyensis TaxID=225894 RepID=UPI000BB850A2|nr:signal peptidase I [Glutamicibacter sp. BW77]
MRKQKGSSESAGQLRAWQRWALNIGAVLGTLCLLMAFCMFAFGLKPLIFASGSMGPEIPTGSLGLAVPAAMSEIVPGEIVSVLNSEGTRVTHRVVENGPSGLILKGDANPVEDLQPYVVETADQLLFSVPLLGYVISWFNQPWAFFVGGLLCAYLLYLAFGVRGTKLPGTTDGNHDSGNDAVSKEDSLSPKRRSLRADPAKFASRNRLIFALTGLIAVASLVTPQILTTEAAFVGSANATAPIKSVFVSSPAGTLGCTESGLLLTTANISWPEQQLPTGARLVLRLQTGTQTFVYTNIDRTATTASYGPGLSLLGLITSGSSRATPLKLLVVYTNDGKVVAENGANIGWSSVVASSPGRNIVYHPGLLLARDFTCS